MPQSGLNIGNDARFDIHVGPGKILSLPTLTKFTSKKVAKKLTVTPLGGLPIHMSFMEGGWEGSFEVSRASGELDSYFATMEANYYAGANQPSGFIQQTISEVDGTVSTFQYQGVVLYYDDAGDYEVEKNVVQKVSFMASTRVKLS
jgi:hypothetical protein